MQRNRGKIGVNLDNKYWYNHVPKSVETIHENKVFTIEPI